MEEGFVWKTRDAAEEMLAERRTAMEGMIVLEEGGTYDTTSLPLTSAMPVSEEFDSAVLIRHRLFHGKAGQIRRAFDAAASCVLRALATPRRQQQSASAAAPLPSASASSSAHLLLDDPDLPPVLRDWARLEESRRHTFDRTHHNKEYSKAVAGSAGGGGKKSKPDSSNPAAEPEAAPALSASGSNLAPSSGDSAGINAARPDAMMLMSSPSLPHGLPHNNPLPPTAVVSSSSASGDAAVEGGGGASQQQQQPPPPPPLAAPKFTRNTPASSAAALDFRFNSSRAILCAAGNLVFEALTPPPAPDHPFHLDALSVPQNPNVSSKSSTGTGKSKNPASAASLRATTSGSGLSPLQVNMGAVVVEAQLLSQRTVSVVENAVRRSELRSLYRKTNAEFDRHSAVDEQGFLQIPNPYLLLRQVTNEYDNADAAGQNDGDDEDLQIEKLGVPRRPNYLAKTESWKDAGLPRFLSILSRGAGHAIYHDYHWKSRHGRLADLLHHLPSKYGPHLIVTIEPDVPAFCQEFETAHCCGLVHRPSSALRAVAYRGTPEQRRVLRTRFFRSGDGLEASRWHVMVTSYTDLLQDFLHFSQIPLDSVVLDDGTLWMAAAHGDPNSALGSIWENLFAKNDQQIGLAGTGLTGDGTGGGGDESSSSWNFALDGRDLPESLVKDGWVGLTCRHRILTSSAMSLDVSRGQDKVPVSGLLSFVMPHFADVVREEWDRSRIASDADSMDHFRALLARSTVAHCVGYVEPLPSSDKSNLQEGQAILALNGKLEARERSDPAIPEVVFDDAFVSDGKINFSRRSCLSWLGRLESSWLRYELGKSMLQHILDAMKVSNRHGHICEEITTASSTTSSGATGQVVGTMAYRLAIRCCRHFGSEQGLRQHVSALHAPPGTWLCRTCGVDCLTSHSRTHHERSCGVPGQGSLILGEPGSGNVGATPTVGQGSTAGKSGVGKKKPGRSSSSQQASTAEEKDADGSFRVPGYRGVWVNQAGKHFVKIDGTRLNREGTEALWLFDNIDDAARKHDEVREKEKKGKLELNFKADGSRIVYEDITPASTSGLGGSATTVVPALSIINIKVRQQTFPWSWVHAMGLTSLRVGFLLAGYSRSKIVLHACCLQDLPPDVKPLLRDPRQTSRTGGNSKRHVYAYRGVCRQARKGHDRWQSQISFMGVNHYVRPLRTECSHAKAFQRLTFSS
jgi:hypothetical protein